MAIEDELRNIRTQISQVQAKKARATVEHENAVDRRDAARAALKEEFGVITQDEAKAKLEELASTLETVVGSVKKSLAEAGA